MGFSKTPKAYHLIFDHAADEQDMFDALGDKIKDPLEKRHQDQMKIDKIISQIQDRFPCRMRIQNHTS